MISSNGTEALIALEDMAPSVLFSSMPNTDIRVWPLLRWLVARATAQTELKTIPVPQRMSRVEKLRRVARAAIPNPYAPSRIGRHIDYLFVVNGGTYSKLPQGRKNWLVDDHASLLAPHAAVLQDLPLGPWTRDEDRPVLSSTYSFERSILRVEAAARRYPLKAADKDFIHDVVSEVFDLIDVDISPELVRSTERLFSSRYVRARHSRSEFERTIDRISPRAVFMQTASYGDRSPLIGSLKDRGIAVIEHQHGWIGPSHAAYNFGTAMETPELSRYLPDVLLTFGDMWSSQIRFPNRSVAVGKPHLESMAAKAAPVNERDQTVLVVSSVLEPEKMEAFALALRDGLPTSWRVDFRPHPSERATVAERYPGLARRQGVRFDLAADVYESLSNARTVVGYASTVLYEALAFGCHVVVKDSPLAKLYIAEEHFEEVVQDDPASLARAISTMTNLKKLHARPTPSLASVWKPHAAANFLHFVESL